MKHLLITILTVFTMLTLVKTASAIDYNISGGFLYTINMTENGQEVTIQKPTTIAAHITIPSTIQGLPVTSIAAGAFSAENLASPLQSVILPETLKKIGSNAFAGNELTSITIPDSVMTIESSAFQNNQLKEITLGKSLQYISNNTFNKNIIKTIHWPTSNQIQAIGYSAFSDNQLKTLKLPDSIQTISYNAFTNNVLESVTLPNQLNTIGAGVFKNNPQLSSLTIPDSVTSISDFVTHGTNISELTLPASVTDFNIAIYEDSKLEKVIVTGSNTKFHYITNTDNEPSAIIVDKLYMGEAKTKIWNRFNVAVPTATYYLNKRDQALVRPKITTKVRFKDVPNSHWASGDILRFVSLGVISGYADGTFRPDEPLRRKHVAVIFNKLFELEVKYAATQFKDVSKKHPYYSAITKVQRAGVFGGSNGYFQPNDTLTRAQMAAILVNASGLAKYGYTELKDVSSTHWAAGQISSLADMGAIKTGNFYPNRAITRAEFIDLLDEVLQHTESKVYKMQ